MNVPTDKLNHFAAGVASSLVALVVWVLSGAGLALLPWFALLASGVAGATKEGADRLDNLAKPGSHQVEWADFFATLAGGAPIAITPWVVPWMLKLTTIATMI